MHPIERLRYVARASGIDLSVLVHETATSLAPMSHDPIELVTTCRRIVSRHPSAGPLWWLCARVLCSSDPRAECWRSSELFDDDSTIAEVIDAIADDAIVCALGWPELVGTALARRGDISTLIVDTNGQGSDLARHLVRFDNDATDIPLIGLGAAVVRSTLVLIECSALGATGAICPAGSRAAAATARAEGIAVWMVCGEGRALPERMWDYVVQSVIDAGQPWLLDDEFVPADLFDGVIGPRGVESFAEAAAGSTAPVAPELLKDIAF